MGDAEAREKLEKAKVDVQKTVDEIDGEVEAKEAAHAAKLADTGP